MKQNKLRLLCLIKWIFCEHGAQMCRRSLTRNYDGLMEDCSRTTVLQRPENDLNTVEVTLLFTTSVKTDSFFIFGY